MTRDIVFELLNNTLKAVGDDPVAFMEEYAFNTYVDIAWDLCMCTDGLDDPDVVLPHVIEWCKEHGVNAVD